MQNLKGWFFTYQIAVLSAITWLILCTYDDNQQLMKTLIILFTSVKPSQCVNEVVFKSKLSTSVSKTNTP